MFRNGGLVHNRPKHAEGADGLEELIEVDRLDDEGVDAEVVTFDEVLFLARGGEHDDGDVAKGGVGLDLAQDFEPVDPGHFQVEQNDAGKASFAIGKLPR